MDVSHGTQAVADEIAKFMAYLFFARKNKMSTVAGKLVAIQYFHRKAGIELPMKDSYLRQVKSGLARESAIHGGMPRIRRPVSWVMIKHGIGLAAEWGEGGKILWLTLAASYFFMCRASEIYAASNGKVHKEFCLTRGDIRFLMGERCVISPALWRFADRVEVRFRASKGNHEAAVVSRVKTTSEQVRINWNWMGPKSSDGGQQGVGGFEVMLELMRMCEELDKHAPIATYADGCRWKVWTEKEATAALRAIIERQGLNPSEYALHSGRIGGATRLAAMGLSTYDIQQQGRWKSQAVGMYIRTNKEAEARVSRALASNALGKGVQPGQTCDDS